MHHIMNHEPENSVRFLDHYQLSRVLTADLGFLLGRELYIGKHLDQLGAEGKAMQQSNPTLFLNCSKLRKEFGVLLWFFVRSRENEELEGAEKSKDMRNPKGSRFTYGHT